MAKLTRAQKLSICFAIFGPPLALWITLATKPMWDEYTRMLPVIVEWADENEPRIVAFAKEKDISLYMRVSTSRACPIQMTMANVDEEQITEVMNHIRSLKPPCRISWSFETRDGKEWSQQDEEMPTYADE